MPQESVNKMNLRVNLWTIHLVQPRAIHIFGMWSFLSMISVFITIKTDIYFIYTHYVTFRWQKEN